MMICLMFGCALCNYRRDEKQEVMEETENVVVWRVRKTY
jgi:hypothetical protein